MKRVRIGKKWVGEGYPAFVIAEAGVNHNGDLRIARRMIDAALRCGADAVKFQTYKTEQIITASAPCAAYHLRARGRKKSWFQLLKELELNQKEHIFLYSYCKRKGIIFLSTAYDEGSADFLRSLGVPAFKIASTDANNIPLLRHIAGFNKPIILSTGLSTLAEVKESVRAIKNTGNKKIILLQCTANYPPLPQDVNLKVLDTLRRECSCLVGYSDHLGWAEGAVAAISRGACTYEVHFTLDRRMAGPDHRSSLEPQELKNIISSIRLAERLLGSAEKKVTASEKETRLRLRKSIVATRDIPAGDTLTLSNIGIKRPGTGLAPEYFNMLLGKLAKRDISKDELILLRDISKKEKLCG